MGGLRQLEGEPETNSEEKWRGISLEYCFLVLTGTSMRHRWISPFDLWGAFVWRARHRGSVENPEGDAKEKRDWPDNP